MVLRRLTALAMVFGLGLLLTAPGCDKKSGDGSTSGKGDDKKAAAKGKKKQPKAKPADAKKTAKKGGDGSKDKAPAKDAKKTDETSAKDKKKVDDAAAGICDDVPDGAAECGGNDVFFCSEKTLYHVDCDAEAKAAGFDLGGACFETEKDIDCLGCIKMDDNSVVCCSATGNYCCTDDGVCWDDAEGGDDNP